MMKVFSAFFLMILLSVSIASDRSEEFFGDLAEGYKSRVKRLSKGSADRWYVRELIVSIGPLLLAPLLALLLKGGMVAIGAAVAKAAVAAKSAAATKAVATGLAA
jgi:hypothetical protein